MQEEFLQFKMQKVEGIEYKEVFDPLARIEAIRLFLAYAYFMGFMDLKTLYPDKVYKVVKVLYGLHQAPKAWYETLANYLLENGFQKGKIDQTLFIKKQKCDILLVQVYVDDIIFGSTNKELCKAFEKLMKDKFQMNGKSASTPIDTEKPLLKDPDGEDVDVHIYRLKLVLLVLIEAQHHISNESALLGVNTPRCDEDGLEIIELMVFFIPSCYKLMLFALTKTHLFVNMLVQQQVQDDAEVEKDEDNNEVPATPSPPTPATTSPP
nr:putative ribonuclease H-like domain-containing protein [Tanacetum cinerariifolium]